MTVTIAATIVVKAILAQIVIIAHVQIVKDAHVQIVKDAHAPIAKAALDQNTTNALVSNK